MESRSSERVKKLAHALKRTDKIHLKEAALLEVLRVIREEEPPRPSTRLMATAELRSIAAQRGLEPKKLAGLLHGELDWIAMKALEFRVLVPASSGCRAAPTRAMPRSRWRR